MEEIVFFYVFILPTIIGFYVKHLNLHDELITYWQDQ